MFAHSIYIWARKIVKHIALKKKFGFRTFLGEKTKILFSYHHQKSTNSKILLVPHSSYQENIGIPGFFIPELSGFASFSSKSINLFNGMIPIGQPLSICEMSIIDDAPRSATVTAKEHTEVIVLLKVMDGSGMVQGCYSDGTAMVQRWFLLLEISIDI